MLKKHLPAMICLLAGLLCVSSGALGFDLSYFPGDLGDARFNNYLLEHAYLFFRGEVREYWNAPFMFPEEDVITYSDNLLGSAPVYMLFRLCGLDTLRAFQFWYLSLTALNFLCAYLFLIYLVRDPMAAALGAMVFAFSLALQSQMGHAQTYPRFAIPLCIWSALLYVKDLRPKYFFTMMMALVFQIYCGIYLGLMLAIPVLVLLLICLFKRPGLYRLRLKDRQWRWRITLSLLTAILVLLPLMLPYVQRSAKLGLYSFQYVKQSLPTLLSYVYSWMGSDIWKLNANYADRFPAFWDHQIFAGGIAVGATVICLCLWFTRRWLFPSLDQNLRLLMFTFVIVFLLFVRFGEFSFYRLVHLLPGYGSMRALQRIINIQLLFMSVSVAYLFSLLFRRIRWRYLLFLPLLLLVIFDNRVDAGFVHRKEASAYITRLEALLAKIDARDKSAIVCYEPDSIAGNPIHYHLDAMLAAQRLGLTTMNGYSATSPGGFGDYWVKPCEKNRITWLQRKNVRGIKVNVVR